MALTKRKKKRISMWLLAFGMFFLPFGYDALFKFVMDLTKSYWTADILFYVISIILFSGYFYFSGTNPLTEFDKWKKRSMKTVKKNLPWLFNRKRKKASATSSSQKK